MENKKIHLSTINKIAAKYELELVKASGYFYWSGITENMQIFTASCYTTSVHIFKLNDFTMSRWMQELETVKNNLKETIIDEVQNIEKYILDNEYYRKNYTFESLYEYWKDLKK